MILLLSPRPLCAQYADYSKNSSVTGATLIFIYCKLNAGQGDKRLLFEELKENNKNANENPLWVSDKDLIQNARETAIETEQCNQLIHYDSFGEYVQAQENKGPKHFSALSKSDQLYVLVLSDYLCKYDSDQMSKFDLMPAEINKAYVKYGVSKISEQNLMGRFMEMTESASTMWLARLRYSNTEGNCLLPDTFWKNFR